MIKKGLKVLPSLAQLQSYISLVELVILSINPTTHPPNHPPLSGQVVSSSNSSNYVNTDVSM